MIVRKNGLMKKTLNKLVVLCILFTTLANTSQAQFELIEKVEAQEGKILIPFEKYRLTSNNLTLIIHEDHSDPIVHVQVAYHVGSARENVRNSGFAHFFEHMMFQGSKNVEDEEHFKIINEAGGDNNAFTAMDKTVYHQTAPSNLTETMLWLEADRMGTHLDGFTQEKFEVQRDAVKNEKKQSYDNEQYGMVRELLYKTLYRSHPYESLPIGFVDDLDAADYSDLRNFFLRWYGPNNATVVVSGDVNPDDVKQWVNTYFGNIKACPQVKKMRPQKPYLPTDLYVATTDNIQVPMTVFAFPTVPQYHKDEAALNVLAQIIGGGNNSILYQNLVKTELAVYAGAGHTALELSGFLQITVLSAPEFYGGLSANDVEEKIRLSIAEFETRGVLKVDMEIVKAQILNSSYSNLGSVHSKADVLGHYHMMKGNGFNLQDDIDRYSTVTSEDVLRVYHKYIKSKKAVILRVESEMIQKDDDDETPKSVNPHANDPKIIDKQYEGLVYSPPVDDFDRSVQPKVLKGKPAQIPSYFKHEFENGLKVIGSPTKESPMVYLYFDIKGAHLLEANKGVKVGTAVLTATMMGLGTAKQTPEEFSRELDQLGSVINFSSDVRSTTIFVQSLKVNIDRTLTLLNEALMTPRFDARDFKRIKKQTFDELRNMNGSSSTLASKAFNQLMFKGSILEKYYYGDIKSISKISLDDVKSFYTKYYSPNVTKLILSGNISEEEMMEKLTFLKEWKNKQVEIPSLPDFEPAKGRTIYLVDKPYASQSTVILAQPSRAYDHNGDYFKSTLMNYSLGDAFNSRINLNLREKNGFTYGAGSAFYGNKQYGYFKFSSEIRKNATDSAIVELMKEINGFINEGITAEELAFTQNSIASSQALQYETPIQKMNILDAILEYDLPENYVDEQMSILANLSVGDVNAVTKSSLIPEDMIIIVVGHGYKVRPGLEKLGFNLKDLTIK